MECLEGWWAAAARRGLDLDRVLEAVPVAELGQLTPSDLLALGVPEPVAGFRGSLWSRGTILRIDDPRYPARLRETAGRPIALFVEGELGVLQQRCVAIVGTRRCTSLGQTAAGRWGRDLAAAGLCVVSGLARGIDAAAHRGALAAGRTLAVLGHGLGHTAPSSHRVLRDQILAAGGAMVSAFPDPLPPDRWTFPTRNTWISGLSEGVVVIEAPEGSGALLTAIHAADLSRPVWVVPGPGGASTWRGGHALLRGEGAMLVDEPVDVLSDLGLSGRTSQPTWLDALERGHPLEQIAACSGQSIPLLLATLQRLEAEGELVRSQSGRYLRRGGCP
jgi:DNA processing protein